MGYMASERAALSVRTAATQGRDGVQGEIPLVHMPCSVCHLHHHRESEEVVHKKCRRYVCCPVGFVVTDTLNRECEA